MAPERSLCRTPEKEFDLFGPGSGASSATVLVRTCLRLQRMQPVRKHHLLYRQPSQLLATLRVPGAPAAAGTPEGLRFLFSFSIRVSELTNLAAPDCCGLHLRACALKLFSFHLFNPYFGAHKPGCGRLLRLPVDTAATSQTCPGRSTKLFAFQCSQAFAGVSTS